MEVVVIPHTVIQWQVRCRGEQTGGAFVLTTICQSFSVPRFLLLPMCPPPPELAFTARNTYIEEVHTMDIVTLCLRERIEENIGESIQCQEGR
jgi:hypothetical protein